jgi:hypothetical protein
MNRCFSRFSGANIAKTIRLFLLIFAVDNPLRREYKAAWEALISFANPTLSTASSEAQFKSDPVDN